jgi:hypothetical protein
MNQRPTLSEWVDQLGNPKIRLEVRQDARASQKFLTRSFADVDL